MGLFSKKSLGAVAGGVAGAIFGGSSGATIGSTLGSTLLGGSDDEMTALQAYNMQRSDALADWNRQNAYNSPVEQMKRLNAAGLNPYLVYSGGNVAGNSSSGIDSVSYNGSYAQPASTMLTKALQNLNLRSMKAETKGKEVDTEMRELDLALKKARLAKMVTASSSNKINSYGLRNPNNWTLKKFLPALYNSLADDDGGWLKGPELHSIDEVDFLGV